MNNRFNITTGSLVPYGYQGSLTQYRDVNSTTAPQPTNQPMEVEGQRAQQSYDSKLLFQMIEKFSKIYPPSGLNNTENENAILTLISSMHPNDINMTDANGNTALHLAAKHMLIKTAKVLCEKGLSSSQTNFIGQSAIDCIPQTVMERSAMLQTLRNQKLVDDVKNLVDLIQIEYQNIYLPLSTQTLRYIETVDSRVFNMQDNLGNTPMHTAILFSNVKVLNSDKKAMYTNKKLMPIVKAILDRNAFDMKIRNLEGKTILHLASNNRSYEATELVLLFLNQGGVLQKKDNIVFITDNKGNLPLHTVCNEFELLQVEASKRAGYMLDVMEKYESDIDQKNEAQKTPLELAIANYHNQITQRLVSRGAKISDEIFNHIITNFTKYPTNLQKQILKRKAKMEAVKNNEYT